MKPPAAQPREGPFSLDADRLSRYLHALGNPVRIRILWALQRPQRQTELQVMASSGWGGRPAERPLTRSAIMQHLEVMEELGLVTRLDAADGKFVVNQQMMVALMEEIGRLARLRSLITPDVEETVDVAEAPPGPKVRPRVGQHALVLTSGPREGDVFVLDGPGPWTLGRAPHANVRLDYDPHVSALHARVRRGAGAEPFLVERMPEARNPVQVDFAPIVHQAPLKAGSVLRLGSSRLVLQSG